MSVGARPPREPTGDSATVGWPVGPTPDVVAEMVRSLELTITRRLDGVLHGNFEGLTPGHGSEPGESRVYQPGDDVRRIDWNVTARTAETHVREQIADRDLTAWLVIDASATMQFGTTTDDKAQVALAAAATVGFLTARNQNRLGAVLVAGPHVRVVPPRSGRAQVRAVLAAAATPPDTEHAGPGDLAGAIARVDALARRRGFVTVVSDLRGQAWTGALGRLGLRHDLLAVAVDDPRELTIPPVGLVEFVDPATGRSREVRVTPEVQRRFTAEADARRVARRDAVRRAGGDLVELSTDGDWLGRIVGHVQQRRVQLVRGGVI
ncbi:MAG: DUF58 domain-containing protein [Actinomycetota bacterium]